MKIIMREGSKINNTGNIEVLSNYGDLLNAEDLSEIFDVSKNTIYKSIKDGKFGKPIQIGRAYKIPKMYVINTFFGCCS